MSKNSFSSRILVRQEALLEQEVKQEQQLPAAAQLPAAKPEDIQTEKGLSTASLEVNESMQKARVLGPDLRESGDEAADLF